jgi:hypothetical protein
MNAIDTFLSEWKKNNQEYYISLSEEAARLKALSDWHSKDDDRTRYSRIPSQFERDYNTAYFVDSKKNIETFTKSVSAATNNILYKMKTKNLPFSLSDFLDTEVEKKKASLINKAEKKGGKIIDASNLFIANDGHINGYIQCEQKQVTVRTIQASGEVQRLHYRVLVK